MLPSEAAINPELNKLAIQQIGSSSVSIMFKLSDAL